MSKNKLFTSLFLSGIILTSSFTVKANENETSTEIEIIETEDTSKISIEVNAGINIDSPFYFIDKTFEKIQLKFTRNDIKRSEKLLKFAEERMSEINNLDNDKVPKYVDDLLDEYSDNINKANEKINELMLTDKLSEEEKLRLHNKLNHVVDVYQALKNTVKDKISNEIKIKIDEINNRTYLSVLASGLTKDEINALKDLGYGYGEILKLNAISKITGVTIEDLKLLDIYDELGEIDFSKVASELNITEDEVMTQIKEYRDTVKDEIRAELEEKAQEIREYVQNRQDEIKKRIEYNINTRLVERRNEITDIINDKIESHLEVLDLLVEKNFITNDDRQIIESQVNEMNAIIIKKIENNELNRNDYEQIGLEISQYIKTQIKEKLESVDISQIDFSLVDEDLREVLGYLLDDSQDVVNNTINKIIINLQNKGVSLTDEEIQRIKYNINEQLSNGEFDLDDYDKILEKIVNVMKDELGREHNNLFDNINQFKDRYQQRQEEANDKFKKEIFDLFNEIVRSTYPEKWNTLSEEYKNEIRIDVLSDLNHLLSKEEIIELIKKDLTEKMNKTDELYDEEIMELFNDTIFEINSFWNFLPTVKKNDIREEILSEIDLTLSEDEIINQVITLFNEKYTQQNNRAN